MNIRSFLKPHAFRLGVDKSKECQLGFSLDFFSNNQG